MTEEQEIFKNMHLQLSSEDIRKVDEWKISRGMKSRTEAIRSMIRIVTTGNLDEDISDIVKGSFAEKNKSDFMKPDSSNKEKNKNESIEELIRKVVKEELSKIINHK